MRYEEKGISELVAMSELVNAIFRRVARADNDETIWSILADFSGQIDTEIEKCFAEMENARRYGG